MGHSLTAAARRRCLVYTVPRFTCDELFRRSWAPSPRFIFNDRRRIFQYGFEHTPSRLNNAVTGEQCSIAANCIAEQPFVGGFFAGSGMVRNQLYHFALHFFARLLHSRSSRDHYFRSEAKAKV